LFRIDEDIEQLRPGEPSGDELATIFRELEFKGAVGAVCLKG